MIFNQLQLSSGRSSREQVFKKFNVLIFNFFIISIALIISGYRSILFILYMSVMMYMMMSMATLSPLSEPIRNMSALFVTILLILTILIMLVIFIDILFFLFVKTESKVALR